MYVNGRIIPVETIPEMGVGGSKGEQRRGWIQVWYIIRTFVNAIIYPQHHNKQSKVKNEKEMVAHPMPFHWAPDQLLSFCHSPGFQIPAFYIFSFFLVIYRVD
jgi:hypothetical protein